MGTGDCKAVPVIVLAGRHEHLEDTAAYLRKSWAR